MKLIKDYQEEVLKGMLQNETLRILDGSYYVEDGISDKKVQDALIHRYGEKLNDYLYEPYGRARILEGDVTGVIEDAVASFAEQILKDCEMLFVASPSKDEVVVRLRDSLDSRYR